MFVEKVNANDYEKVAEKVGCRFAGMDKNIGSNGEWHVEFCSGSFSAGSHIWFSDFSCRTSADIKNIEEVLNKVWVARLSLKFGSEYISAYKNFLKQKANKDFGISF